jgi:hypothetical protein
MWTNFQEAAAATAASAGSLLPPEIQAVLDLTGCAAVVVVVVLFLRHLKFLREASAKERETVTAEMKMMREECAKERKEYLAMIERIEGKFADVVEDLMRDR